MSDDQTGRGQEPAAGWDMSRRTFVYGSAAVLGSAALLGRTPARRPPLRRAPLRGPLPIDPTGFTLAQNSPPQTGGGGIALPLPAASAVGTLLVATLLSPDGTPFAVKDSTSGWQHAKTVTCDGGRLEQWYWANNPGGKCGPNSGMQFTGGTTCLGGIAEFTPPANTVVQILDAVGRNSGTGSAQAVDAAAGTFAGTLGVFSQAEFFGGSTNGTWTLPKNYSDIVDQDTGASVWSHAWNDLAAGNHSPIGGFSDTSGTGWAAALCCYRAVTVAPIGIVGGEVTNCLDLDPTGQMLVVGGDVEGCWRSANHGDNWQPADFGGIVPGTSPVQTVLADADQISFADIKWSLLEAGTVYACVGKTGSGYGAFLASKDGGCTWQQRNDPNGPQLLFYGNGTPADPPRDPNVNQDADRTVNRLIAQDPANNLLYLVTANQGVMLSKDKGVTWTSLFFNDGTAYPRCITINPNNPNELWAGMWFAGAYSGVYYCSSALTEPTIWNPVPGFPDTIADLKVVGSGGSAYLYAACDVDGIYRYPISGGSPVSLNGTGSTYGGKQMDAIDTNTAQNPYRSIWVSLDGYEDTSVTPPNHVIIAGCSGGILWKDSSGTDPNHTNIVQLTLSGGNTPATYEDLIGPNQMINIATLPPFGKDWWHYKDQSDFQIWLGGNQSVNPHILIDPNDNQWIYVTGGGGFFRSTDGGTSWDMAVTGMPMLGMHCFAIDPANGSHFVHTGDDYTSIDVTDPTGADPAAVTSTDPSPTLEMEAGDNNHRESHAVCFDSSGNVYLGLNSAYSQPGGGGVLYRASSVQSITWKSTGFELQPQFKSNPSNAPAVIGLFAGGTGSNAYVVAVATGPAVNKGNTNPDSGTYRWTSATGWAFGTSSPQPGASPNTVGQHVPIVAGDEAGHVYCYDRMQGLFLSTDSASTWSLIWPQATNDSRTGWLAVSPSTPGEVWVSTDQNLWQLTVSNGAVTSINPVGAPFTAGAAGVGFGPEGSLYAIALPGAAPLPSVTTLYVLAPTVGATWTDFCDGDGSVGSYGPPAGQLGISSTGWMWVTGGEHVGFWTQVPTLQG